MRAAKSFRHAMLLCSLALAAGFVRGWFAHAACASVDQAQESEKRLRGLKPFW